MDYPELAARTEGYRAGEPHSVTVSGDGARVVFLRCANSEDAGNQLWVFDVATATERLVFDPATLCGAGIDSYATDTSGRIAALAAGGALAVVNLVEAPGAPAPPRQLPCAGPVVDPRPDPTGHRVAYVSGGALHVLDLVSGEDTLLAGEPDHDEVSWGLPEFVSVNQFRRERGYWWSPDGTSVLATRVDTARVLRWQHTDLSAANASIRCTRYPAAGTANAEVSVHVLDLDGGWVDVHWDRETYPYLVAVSWSDVGGPLVTVLRRLQQHGLVLAVDPRTGETQVHAELADPRWVEPIAGSPRYLPDGRVLIGGELAHDGYDARCLFADGGLLTPTSLYVRRVCGQLGRDLLIEASDGEPSEQHLYRVMTRAVATGVGVHRLTQTPGWHTGHSGGDTLVVGSRSLDHAGTRWTVQAGGAEVGTLRSLAITPGHAPRPALERVTDRRLPTGVLYPRSHVAGRRLPVLVDINGGPGQQEVLAARTNWLARAEWTEAGFAVVVIDNRGTPGVAPSFEKAVHRRLADVILADQVDALAALAAKHPDLDLARVGVRGRHVGGWLASLAALRRPDVYRCAIAHAPVSDWAMLDTAYAERLLGLPGDTSEIYAHNCLLDAADPVRGAEDVAPLLIIHDVHDERVPFAHTMRLSAALVAAGRPHAVIPVTEATHAAVSDAATGRAGDALARQLRALELDFLRRNLS